MTGRNTFVQIVLETLCQVPLSLEWNSEREIGAEVVIWEREQQEVHRLRQAISIGAHKLSRTELSNLLGQLKQAEDLVEAVESKVDDLNIQAREFKKTAMNPAYNRCEFIPVKCRGLD